jgi:uncharacterized membrane protein YfcA
MRDVNSLTSSPVIGATVAGSTTGAGLGAWLDLIPNEIGKLASLIGIFLSFVLIYVHLRKFKAEMEEHKSKMTIYEYKQKELEKKDSNVTLFKKVSS